RDRLKQELRGEILAAARNLFMTEGYVNVCIRKVAERVGCSTGTIYLHFEDKNSILSAICIQAFVELNKRMEAICHDRGDPLERLRRGSRTYIQFSLDHPFHYLVMFGLNGTAGVKDEATRNAAMHSLECMRQCVHSCIEAGALRKTDIDEVTHSLW